MKFTSSKVFDGYSTCFRQWKAEGTQCQYLHGYALSFEVWFTGGLDERNWVWDFGGMKRAKNLICGKQPDQYFKWLLDHTVILAKDDPQLPLFKALDDRKAIQLRIIERTGCERFAEFLFGIIDDFVDKETKGRVRVQKVEVREHYKNAASYER